jgi:hypothetical protein
LSVSSASADKFRRVFVPPEADLMVLAACAFAGTLAPRRDLTFFCLEGVVTLQT